MFIYLTVLVYTHDLFYVSNQLPVINQLVRSCTYVSKQIYSKLTI